MFHCKKLGLFTAFLSTVAADVCAEESAFLLMKTTIYYRFMPSLR